MRRRGRALAIALAATAVAPFAVSGVGAETGDVARARGVQLTLPSGWSRVVPAHTTRLEDPRTVLVIGTDGVRAVESDCQVATYRVPADGAVVVVVGWRDSVGGSSFLPLSAMKLRRGTFECFAGRGAVGRLTLHDRDFQVNVMIGDRASAGTIADALAAAHSLGLAPRA
jgi:hypothetical protein